MVILVNACVSFHMYCNTLEGISSVLLRLHIWNYSFIITEFNSKSQGYTSMDSAYTHIVHCHLLFQTFLSVTYA